jgi:predicted transcriptional regulator
MKKTWEVSLIELTNKIGKKYKVTRIFPELSISETKVFRTKKAAEKQIMIWLAD